MVPKERIVERSARRFPIGCFLAVNRAEHRLR